MGFGEDKFMIVLFLILSLSTGHDCVEDGEENIKGSDFPNGFLFGTGTSSYQVEGAYIEDGKSLSNWDVFTHIQGNVKNGDNGDVADDHYHRFLEDIDLMHSLGTNAYRFSISWSRILPRGRFEEVNPNGIKVYNSIIDSLLIKGIEPFPILHHYDLPQELHDRYGSWLSPLMQEDFVYFAEVCFKSFGDRIMYWATINEPNLEVEFGYVKGCSSHQLVVQRLLEIARKSIQRGSIGIIALSPVFEPMSSSEADKQAASRAMAFVVGWVLDPKVHGDYPWEMRQYLGNLLPIFSSEEVEYVKGSVDFIGINHYQTLYAKDCLYSACDSSADRPIQGFTYTTGERYGVPNRRTSNTANPPFFVVPRGMEKIINYVKERYDGIPMFVTENGYAPPGKQNEQLEDLLLDANRISHQRAYLAALAKAIRNGADVRVNVMQYSNSL